MWFVFRPVLVLKFWRDFLVFPHFGSALPNTGTFPQLVTNSLNQTDSLLAGGCFSTSNGAIQMVFSSVKHGYQ